MMRPASPCPGPASLVRHFLLAWILLSISACADAARGGESVQPRQVAVIEGFDFPESVQYDPDQDVFFVSNMAGYGSAKDGTGYISRFSAARPEHAEPFIVSGRGGATLNAPKGMEIQGGTLWVADIDVLRGFDRYTGTPVAEIDFTPHGAVLLNAVALGPDGELLVTDSGIVMSAEGVHHVGGEKIFRVDGAGTVGLVAEGADLGHPNGIVYDLHSRRWIVVSFHPFRSELYALDRAGGKGEVLFRGKGRFDGVDVLADGSALVTAWSDSSLHLVRNGVSTRIIRDLWQPADFGVDTRRNRVAIPQVILGKVGLWDLP